MIKNFFTFSRFTLFVALCISAIAAWYSVAGLTAIFAGALIPIIIMGGILEIAKITTTVWLHHYWHLAGRAVKTYLTIAVMSLAFLTSMGIFGFLSKAHIDQGVPTSDVAASVAAIDERIKTERDNIEANKQALKQLDAQVDQILARSDSENGAARSANLRRSQQKERTNLLTEIQAAQAKIAKLNEERAPIASQLRKVEAEVGPIKYIAALIYGDNPDSSLLERAVRWVIILIVSVFDPLAIILILAANNSLKWDRELRERKRLELAAIPEEQKPAEPQIAEDTDCDHDHAESLPEITPHDISTPVTDNFAQGNYATPNLTIKPLSITLPSVEPVIETAEPISETVEEIPQVTEEAVIKEVVAEVKKSETPAHTEVKIKTDNITSESLDPNAEYTTYDGKKISVSALKEIRPDLVVTHASLDTQILFGSQFPKFAKTGDIYVRIDVVPHKVYKFNGTRWINLDKQQSTTYLQNQEYLKLLIAKVDKGEYDPEFLTDAEQTEISEYLKSSS